MIGAISVVAFNFMVQEPRGIMVLSKAKSRSANCRIYLVMAASERFMLNTGFCMNSEVRTNSAGMAFRLAGSNVCISVGLTSMPNDKQTFCKTSEVVVSSSEIPMVFSSIFLKLIPLDKPCPRIDEESPT